MGQTGARHSQRVHWRECQTRSETIGARWGWGFLHRQEEKEISAVAQGQGNLEIILTLIPRQEEIFQGDIVITSSLGGIFSESLLIGNIQRISRNDIDPFQAARIENSLNIFELKNVLIIND